jgi:hypothetical protein
MLSILFYANATVATFSSIIMGFAGMPLPCFVFCAYATMCIIIGTACLED